MAYVVDQVGLTAEEDVGESNLAWQFQRYLNHKHEHCKPWQLVNVVSIEKLYLHAEDLKANRVSGWNVTMIWRTH